jgi:hypothetical protein
VNVHVLVLLPPLEHAPDQIASRPLATDSVIDAPLANDADPVVPTATLIPAGFDRMLVPVRPFAVTVRVTVDPGGWDAGVTLSEAVFAAPPAAAVIVTAFAALTAMVVTANVAVVAPALTVIFGGTVAIAVSLLPSDTSIPPVGAALVNVAVPCDELPPTTLAGLRTMVDSVGPGGGAVPAFTDSDVAALNRRRPEIVTAVSAVTVDVATGNVAREAPAGTVTVAGTVAAPLELKSCTGAPPLGAAPASVTVPVAAVPPLTLAGVRTMSTSGGIELAGGFTVNPRLAALAPYEADTDAGVVVETDRLVTNANEALVEPVKTVTLVGSELKSSGWFVDSETSTGAGAGAASATVATPPSPPRSVVTFAPSDDTLTPATAATDRTLLSAVPSK